MSISDKGNSHVTSEERSRAILPTLETLLISPTVFFEKGVLRTIIMYITRH
jgi:hypothetical protein